MQNFCVLAGYPHGNNIYSVLDAIPAMARHPDQRRSPQLLKLIEVDGAYRTTKAEVGSGLYLNEGDRLASLDYEVQVSMAVLETVRENAPALFD